MKYKLAIAMLLCIFKCTFSLPDQGKWDYNLTRDLNNIEVPKSMFKGSHVFLKLNCEANPTTKTPPNITIRWVILQSKCWDFIGAFKKVKNVLQGSDIGNWTAIYHRSWDESYKCDDHIILKEITPDKGRMIGNGHPVYITPADGLYFLGLQVTGEDFNLGVHLEMRSDYGYLSAVDWPLLPFYGFMCIFYVILGVLWMIMSFLQWRDLIRVQFWIGGVIFLGMLEKATFYAEYQSINNTGTLVQSVMLFAEWVSCAKRTLARMLVVIVSLGFGIVKPRLSAALHRVVGVGLLYFVLASSEAYLRVTGLNSTQNRDLLVASVPLAILDSAICWWIFSALVNTTRTLRLRRNEVKLNLYRHFTNTLIFAVVASIIFMLYSIKTHRVVACLVVWKDMWLEDAYWHILFSALLLVIMVLWRPTNNNQRYAFVPLLEAAVDDEEEEHLVNDAYGLKVRMHNNQANTPMKHNSIDDDIRWLEENVDIEPTLPVLDSDEERVNTRFEVSKMQ